MEISTTFVTGLLSFRYDNERDNEFVRLLRLWRDVEYLENFFDENHQDLQYFGDISVESAVRDTFRHLQKFEDFFINIEGKKCKLSELFKPLNNDEYHIIPLSKQKASRHWLRLYAIKIDNETFIITGGTIKLTQRLEDRPHGKLELKKLRNCQSFLKSKEIFDADSFFDFFIE